MALSLDFLPDFSLHISPVLAFGVALLISTVAADLLFRNYRIPRAVTYMVLGMVFGGPGFKFFSADITGVWRPVIDMALGILLFQLGQRLDLVWLRHNKWLALNSLIEAAFTFCVVFWGMTMFEIPYVSSALVAAVAVSTCPAVTVSVVTEARSRGQVTDRLLLLSGVNTLLALLIVKIWIGWGHLGLATRPFAAVFHPVYLLFGSTLLGFAVAWIYGALSRFLSQKQDIGLARLALVFVGVEVADLLHVSPFLSMLAAGLVYRARARDEFLPSGEFGFLLYPVQAFLFLAVGASTGWYGWSQALPIVIVLVSLRVAAKMGTTLIFARPSGLTVRQAFGLGSALLPMSALAFLLAADASVLFPELDPEARTVLLGLVAVFQLVGPMVARLGLDQLARECRRTP